MKKDGMNEEGRKERRQERNAERAVSMMDGAPFS